MGSHCTSYSVKLNAKKKGAATKITAKSAAPNADVALAATKQHRVEWALQHSVENASRKKAKSACIIVNQAGPSIPRPESTFKIKR